MTEPVRHKSFTKDKNKEPVTFELDGDTFYCAPKLPMNVVREVGQLRQKQSNEEFSADKFDHLINLLRSILLDESIELFNQRLADKKKPIDVNEISDIIAWLLEVYGLRPFQESSDSVNGSSVTNTENAGISLTDGAPVLELIPSESPQTGS